MALSLEQVKDRIQNPRNKTGLQRAYEKKLRQNVHTEPIASRVEYTQGHNQLLLWIKDDVLNNEQSFQSLNGLIVPPFPTNELNETIFQDVSRIFNGQNFYQKLEWAGSTSKDKEAKSFLDKIGDSAFWESEAIEVYKNNVDSFVVCDKPRKDPDNPNQDMSPFYYILSVEKVVTVEIKKKGYGSKSNLEVEFIAFNCGNEKEKEIAYFDADQIIIFDEGMNLKSGPVFHEVGWCPVHPFWQTTLNSYDCIQKQNRATKSISDMDWLFFYEYAKRWQDLNNPFPVWAMYDSNCQYKDKDGNECSRGYIYFTFNGQPRERPCPECSKKFRRGPDRVVKVPAPQSKDDPDLMSHPPVQVIAPGVESQEFVKAEVERLYNFILKNCAGINSDSIKKQAINEDQVQTSLDSQKSILVSEKRNFDAIRNWVTETLLKMQFGKSFVKAATDHGEEFFLESEMEQVKEYETAKKSNLPIYDLKTRREALLQSKFRNNPDALERAKLMAALEPFPDYTLTEMVTLRATAPEAVSMEDLVLKKNFSNFIDRFEAENGSLAMFGSNLKKDNVTDDGQPSQKVRLDQIKQILNQYGQESINTGRDSFKATIQAEREKSEREDRRSGQQGT